MSRNSSSPRKRGPSDSVNKLLAAASEIAERRDQRAAWVRKTCAALRQAQHAMEAARAVSPGD